MRNPQLRAQGCDPACCKS